MNDSNRAYYSHSEPQTLSSTYKSFDILPRVSFYWLNEKNCKDRGIIIGWLFWEADIQLNYWSDINPFNR